MRLPSQLSRIGDVLPLTTAIREQGVSWFHPLRGRTKDLNQVCARMSSAFLNDLHSHSFARNPSWNEQHTSLITTYGIASVGKVCKFNINANVHLGGHLTTLHVVDAVPPFQRVCMR